MKKYQIRHFIFLLAALPVLFISCHKDVEYELDFAIDVPENWIEAIYGNEGFIYGAARNPVNKQDTIVEALYIFKESKPNFTLPIYYNWLSELIFDSPAYDSLLYESDTVINSTNFKKMFSLEKWRHINSYQDTFYLDALTTRYFFFENNYGYNMVFISLDSTFYRNQPIFNDIMSTFQFRY